MSRATRKTDVRHTVFGLGLAGLAICSVSTAKAGDFDVPAYGPYGVPVERGGICRIFHERRIDAYGREIVHRIRLCDEGPVYSGPDWSVPQEYGYRPQRHYEPFPSHYYSYPRPPAPIGPTYYN
jgi:hypothetical protein